MAENGAVADDGQQASEEVTLDYLAMKRTPSKERTANLAGVLPASSSRVLSLDDSSSYSTAYVPRRRRSACNLGPLKVCGASNGGSWRLCPGGIGVRSAAV